MQHELKTLNPYFTDVMNGTKKFEVRKDDRNYQVGDILVLQEYEPETPSPYTGRKIKVEVVYKLAGGNFGVLDGHCVLGFDVYLDMGNDK